MILVIMTFYNIFLLLLALHKTLSETPFEFRVSLKIFLSDVEIKRKSTVVIN